MSIEGISKSYPQKLTFYFFEVFFCKIRQELSFGLLLSTKIIERTYIKMARVKPITMRCSLKNLNSIDRIA